MEMCRLGRTDIEIAPLVLGGNVFGWNCDRETTFAVLDAFLDAGFNAVDTADVYNRYQPGLKGGESETLIGEWMKQRGNRDKVVVVTKGGLPMGEGMEGLGRDYLPRACEASLERLQTDHIDVYMAHRADANTPIEETLETFQGLIDAGKIRHAGASNYTAGELQQALAAAAGGSCARYEVVQPLYNLAQRSAYEGELEDICVVNDLGVIAYYALAAGFLTGKYRSEADLEGADRGHVVSKLLNAEGLALLEAVDDVAARHSATPAQVSLAWLMARPSVTAPIASVTKMTQLEDILAATRIALSAEDVKILDAARVG
jgi:aryl-alcohol dehydrogenase-like predicted oxidoreductase